MGDDMQARAETQRVIAGLSRQRIPPLVQPSAQGIALNLSDLAQGCAVFYLYPGSPSSPDDGPDTAMVDAVQHRAFRDRLRDLTARHVNVVGLSSEALSLQYRSLKANRLTQSLVSDPECQLARTLGLPTFSFEGRMWYRRLTLVVCAGRISKVFFPVPAARNADQVLAWMKLRAL
jgi:peroxiredoxin